MRDLLVHVLTSKSFWLLFAAAIAIVAMAGNAWNNPKQFTRKKQ